VDTVSGLAVWPAAGDAVYYESNYGSSGPVFLELGQQLAVTVTFYSERGPVPPESLGIAARLELIPDPEELLSVSPRPDEPFGFDLLAGEPAEGRLGFRLAREHRTLYRSIGAVVQVVDPPATDWTPIDPGHPPDGPVRDLLVHGDRLIVGGDFSNIGGIAARGVAAWDGASWSAFAGGLDGVIRLHADGEDLLAEASDGFYRWSGTAWEQIAPHHDRAIASTVYRGQVMVTGSNLGVLAWTGQDWEQVGDVAWTGEALAVHGARLYAAGTARSPGGTIPYITIHIWRSDGGSFSSIYSRGLSDLGSCTVELLKSGGSDLLASLACGSPGGYFGEVFLLADSGVTQPIAQYAVTAGTRLEDRYAFAAWRLVYLEEESGLRVIGTAEEGTAVRDLESFDGALVAGGDFTTLNGREASYLARWVPGAASHEPIRP